MNKVILIGNLGKDPELKYAQSGTAIANLSVATAEKTKDANGNWIDGTEWHNVVVFGKSAEFCSRYLRKGSTVAVEGRNKTKSYENKKGDTVFRTEVFASDIKCLDKKNSNSSAAPVAKPQKPTYDSDDLDDLPY